ncbi:MAG: DNA polymerase III subunit beta [Actinomycetales bacterium]|nr:DNA polymerase III subunit beta [Actinomycetales bacterium]
MKFRVERDALADAVAWAARTLPSRPSLPILAGLLIEADTSGLVISSFDYETSSRVEVGADVNQPGRALVSGRLLADIGRSLPAQPVTVTLDGTRVAVVCGKSSFTLPTFPVEDYPALPAMPSSSGTIPGDVFASAVAQVAVAAGRDDTLPTLTGIRIEVEGAMITLAATDRYRLAMREFSWSPSTPSLSVNALVPARTLAETAKSLAGADTVNVSLAEGGEGLMGFEGEGRRTTTRLLDGEFPKYRSLLPNETLSEATVNTGALIESVKRVALVAERNTPVRLTFSDGEVVLTAGTFDEAQATESVECALQGDGLEIAFNPQYLLDGLGALDAAFTRLAFTQSTRPAVLSGVDEVDGQTSADYRYLLMPVRLAG